MDLIDKALEFAAQIQSSPEFTKMIEARENNDNDEVLQKLMQKFTLLRGDLEHEAKKDDLDDAKLADLDREVNAVYEEIMQNETMKVYAAAEAEFSSIAETLNAILLSAVNGENPADALMPAGGGCPSGGCSGCSGC